MIFYIVICVCRILSTAPSGSMILLTGLMPIWGGPCPCVPRVLSSRTRWIPNVETSVLDSALESMSVWPNHFI